MYLCTVNNIVANNTNGYMTKYTYSATGQKLSVEHFVAQPNVTWAFGVKPDTSQYTVIFTGRTDYLLGGSLVVQDGATNMLLFDGGYAKAERISSTAYGYTLFYYNQDHLGNIREVMNASGTLMQRTNYYPFGGIIVDICGEQDIQPYKYNGKELDLMHGLNTYDYGARQYNPVTAHWDRVDPLAEKYYGISPYNYCGGNPVNAIDIDGMRINYYNSADHRWYTYYNGYFYLYKDVKYDMNTNDVAIKGRPVVLSNHPNDYMTKTLNFLNKMASSEDEIIREVFSAAQDNGYYEIDIRKNLNIEKRGSRTVPDSDCATIYLDFEDDFKPDSEMIKNHATEYDVFGHEFKHGYDFMYHLDSDTKYGNENFTIDEFYTVQFENRIRKDGGNKYRRTSYGKVTVPKQYKKFLMYNRNINKIYEIE